MRPAVGVGHPDQRVHDPGRVDQTGEDLLVPLLGCLDQDPQRSARGQDGEEVPQRDGGQHHPRRPVGKVLDEDQGHEGGDED